MILHCIYRQCGWGLIIPQLCWFSIAWILDFEIMLVHNSSLLPSETVLMGNNGSEGHWVEVTCLLSLFCLLCVSLCLACHFLAPIPHDRVNATVRMSPLATSPSSCACVCPARVCLFVPKHPASLLIEFSLSHLCVSTWLSSRYDWHCPLSSFREEPKHPYPSPLLHSSLSVLLRYWEMLSVSSDCFNSRPTSA